jgi:hypothetical protein
MLCSAPSGGHLLDFEVPPEGGRYTNEAIHETAFR